MALIAHWPLNGDILDYSGNGFHLTNNGSTINNEGKIGKCYEFNGTNNYLNLNKFPLYQEEEITFSFWCYLKSNNTQNFLCSREAVGNGFCVFYISNGIRFDFDSQWQIPNSKLELNKWHHCIFIRNKNKRKFYLNGQFIAETNDFGDFNTQILNRFSIGASYPASYNNFLNGKLNDIKLFNHELSKKEIKELYQTKILDWKFNECEEPTINLLYSNKQTFFNNFVDYENTTDKYKVECVKEVDSFNSKVMKLTVTSDKDNDGKWNNGYPNGVEGYENSKKIDLIPGKKYTLTYRYKTKNYQKGSIAIWSHSRRLDGTAYSTNISGLSDTNGEWQIFKFNFTCPNDVNGRHFNPASIRHNNEGFEYYVDWMQLEEKEYATEYTPNERKGKVIDSSGYKNHGLIELNSSPKWLENKEYEFDGTNLITLNKKILNNEQQDWTLITKINLNENIQPVSYINNFNLGTRIIHNSTGNALNYINSGTNDMYVYSYTSIPKNKEIEVCFSYSFLKNQIKFYINGELSSGNKILNNSELTKIPNGIPQLIKFFENFKGTSSFLKIFAIQLSDSDIKELYENQLTIDKNNNINCNEIIENNLKETTQQNSNIKLTIRSSNNNVISGQISFLKINDEIKFENLSRGLTCYVLSNNLNIIKYANFDTYAGTSINRIKNNKNEVLENFTNLNQTQSCEKLNHFINQFNNNEVFILIARDHIGNLTNELYQTLVNKLGCTIEKNNLNARVNYILIKKNNSNKIFEEFNSLTTFLEKDFYFNIDNKFIDNQGVLCKEINEIDYIDTVKINKNNEILCNTISEV